MNIHVNSLPIQDEIIKSYLEEFKEIYSNRPIQDNIGGMKAGDCFYLYSIVKYLNPENIIESGVWKGQTTWVLRKACPEANIICLDPYQVDRHEFYYKDNLAIYSTIDFKDLNIIKENTFVLLDDHQNKWDRLLQCIEKGIKNIFFHDDYYGGDHLTFNEIINDISKKDILEQFIKIEGDYYKLKNIIPNVKVGGGENSLFNENLDIFDIQDTQYEPSFIKLK